MKVLEYLPNVEYITKYFNWKLITNDYDYLKSCGLKNLRCISTKAKIQYKYNLFF